MNYLQAAGALQRLNVQLETMNSRSLENLVYGRSVPTSSLVTMHKASAALQSQRQTHYWATQLTTEASGALRLKARQGDKAAEDYLNSIASRH